jgi:hypothetical protein
MPTIHTRGYGPFRGRVACDCLRAWLPAFEAELKRVGVIRESIDIAQLTGGAAASGGTHSQGGAADIWQRDERTIRIAREMGAAAWARTKAQGFSDPHCHLVLNGCPHNGPARYQVNALAAGYNGLGYAGLGARDDGPEPRHLRTWTAGIRWAKARQKPKRVKYRVHVAQQPDDFRPSSVRVFAGPGHHYDVVKTVEHGALFTASGKTRKTKSGQVWREGIRGGWLPDRRLRKA